MVRPLAILVLAGAAQAAVMPLPMKISRGVGRLPIDSGFTVANNGCPEAALARFRSRVARQTGIFIIGGGAGLEVTCHQPAPAYPALGDDESYILEVSSAGARLEAPDSTGALRGLETFSQLIVPGAEGFEVPAVRVEDRPRFPWRGLMLDVARHWMPPEVVTLSPDLIPAAWIISATI